MDEVAGALEHGIASEHEASEMKASLRMVMELGITRGAFGVLARGRLTVAARASEVLATAFKRPEMAALIDAAARDNAVGSVLRLIIRSIRTARSLYFAGKRYRRYPAESELVRNRLLQLQ